MGHLIKYSFLHSVRQKDSMFWGLLFPIILSLLFFMSFMGGGKKAMETEPIKVAVSLEKESQSNQAFETFLESINGDVVEIGYMTETEGKKELLAGHVKGIYTAGKERRLYVSGNGMEESILEAVLEGYNQNEALLMDVAQTHPEKMEQVIAGFDEYKQMTREISLGQKTMDGNIQFFFALIAMACMYGCFLGLQKGVDIQANLSTLGARRSVTPTHRLKVILADMTVSFGIHFSNLVVLLLFLKYVLKLEFQGNMGGMLLVCMLGSLIGVSMGIMVGSMGKRSMGMKVGILLGISMVCSFLSGLMANTMKDIIERNIPILNRINPAALISDAFYCLTVYSDAGRYYRDLAILGGMSVLFVFISFQMVRRERYDSI